MKCPLTGVALQEPGREIRLAGTPGVDLEINALVYPSSFPLYAAALAEKFQAKFIAAEWSALNKLVGAQDLRQSIRDELPLVLRWLLVVE